MPTILFNEQRVETEKQESVLDALIRNGIDVAYSCKSGVCQACMMKCVDGAVPAEAQKGLKPIQVDQNYFLACQCRPLQDITIAVTGQAEETYSATLLEKQSLSPSVFSLRLEVDTAFAYMAGQFVNLKRADGLIRSYSLASLPAEDDAIELHIRRMPNGDMSNWLFDEFAIGDTIYIQGPIGDCVYHESMHEQPILLIGSSTGLAPLLGVVRDALHHSHQQPIHLYHAAYNTQELYMDKALRALCATHDNLHYTGCITEDMPQDQVTQGRACEVALTNNPDLKGWQVFVCGAPSLVRAMQKSAFLAGASVADIHSDPFETKDLRFENATSA